MQKLKRVGAKSEILLKRSFFLSKYLTLNPFTIPVCKHVRITFPLYEPEGELKSKGVIIMLEFLEQLSGTRAIIKNANLIVGNGLWVRGQVNLSSFKLMNFCVFFNEYILSHPLLRFAYRLPLLRVIRKNFVKLIISEIDFFFDAFTRRHLPHAKLYWLEIDFFFENQFHLEKKESISFYTQYFFSHNILEWRSI